MTDDDKALVERLRDNDRNIYLPLLGEAADRIEAQAAEIERLKYNGIHSCHDQCERPLCVLERENERLREALKQIETGTYPRPLGKSWRMDLSSSKHDRCIHDEWMYEVCEECLDDFVRATLGETK